VSVNLAFIGCYTVGAGGEGEGVVRAQWDRGTGALRDATVVGITPAPSFLVRHPEHPVLYAANELTQGKVSAFSVVAGGALALLGTWPSGGADPCHLSLDPSGRNLLIANYGTGTVTAHALDGSGRPTGHFTTAAHSGHSKHPERQAGPHAHAVAATPDGLLAVDLGVDTVFFYRLDRETGSLGPGEVAFRTRPGTGPRHLARDDAGRLLLVGELDASLSTYEQDADGWHEISRVATSEDAAAIPSEIGRWGDYLYVANRGPDTIATFSLASGRPEYVGEVPTGGVWPRHFAIDGDILVVANERSHTVVSFRLDPQTGHPAPTGEVLSTPSPACVLFWSPGA
jgi:6-phosphogluconolactonase